jgi:hypothetical protein
MKNRDELLALHDKLCAEAKEIMKVKNQDYTAGSGDPFANFRGASMFGIEPEQGLILRMQDKLMRVVSFIKLGELAVPDEGILDIGHDLINYSILLTGLMLERKESAAVSGGTLLGKNSTIPFSDTFKRQTKPKRTRKPRAKRTKAVLIPNNERHGDNENWD